MNGLHGWFLCITCARTKILTYISSRHRIRKHTFPQRFHLNNLKIIFNMTHQVDLWYGVLSVPQICTASYLSIICGILRQMHYRFAVNFGTLSSFTYKVIPTSDIKFSRLKHNTNVRKKFCY